MSGISIVHALGFTDRVVDVDVYFHAHNRLYPRGDKKFSKKRKRMWDSQRFYRLVHNGVHYLRLGLRVRQRLGSVSACDLSGPGYELIEPGFILIDTRMRRYTPPVNPRLL
jgi:hypothetical protein